MGPTWDNGSKLEEVRIGPIGWIRALMRGLVLGTVVFGGLVILLLVRLIERPICGVKRPVTPYITQFVCRLAFVILGIRHRVRGIPMREQGAVVAKNIPLGIRRPFEEIDATHIFAPANDLADKPFGGINRCMPVLPHLFGRTTDLERVKETHVDIKADI